MFDVICGDFNFDNCSSGEVVVLPSRVSSWGGHGLQAQQERLGFFSLKNFLLLGSMWVRY